MITVGGFVVILFVLFFTLNQYEIEVFKPQGMLWLVLLLCVVIYIWK